MLQRRDFDGSDGLDTPPLAFVGEALAGRHVPAGDAVGEACLGELPTFLQGPHSYTKKPRGLPRGLDEAGTGTGIRGKVDRALRGFLTVVITAAGLTAATAQLVTRRTRELGIRLALGAQPGDLVKMLLGRSLLAVGAGALAGAVLAYGVERSLRVFLFGVSPADGRVFAASVLLLVVVGAVATYVPALRARSVDPAQTLRAE